MELIEACDRYLEAALLGDRPAAARLTAGLLAEGHDARAVVTNLLIPAQLVVGDWWQDRRVTVGQEHIATGVTESILASLTVGFEPPAEKGTFVLVCADGEWHNLPARFAAELLALDGWSVTVLGAGMPTNELHRTLLDFEADAVGVSCTIPTNLAGAARTIDAARRAGHRVIAGGRAFGCTPDRAWRLGAHGWASQLDHGFDLESCLFPTPLAVPMSGAWRDLERRRSGIVISAVARLRSRSQSIVPPSMEGANHLTREVELVLQAAIASLLCHDPTILSDFADWMRTLMEEADLPDGLAASMFQALAMTTEPITPDATVLLAREIHR